jgi:hypothetical protein
MRAATVLARADWVRRHHGPLAVERVLASMPPELAHEIRGAVVPSLWVSFPAVMAFIEAIDHVLGRGDLALVRPLARHAARTNMPLLHRIFYKLGSVEYIMTKAAAVWHAHYDSGGASSRSIPGGLRFSIEGFATPHRVHCLTVLGWSEEIVSLCEAEILDAREVQCRLTGGAVCEFEVRYRQ